MLHLGFFVVLLLSMLKFIEKIKNPNAKMHNIALGFIYVAVFGAMLAFSIYWHFFLRAEGI